MEADDWTHVIFHNHKEHYGNCEAVAKALSIALIGDDKDWQQHKTNAKRFLEAMETSRPRIVGLEA